MSTLFRPVESEVAREGVSKGTSSDFSVRELDSDNEGRWDDFVKAHPQGSFYHLAGWRKVFERTLKQETRYLYCASGTQVKAILPLTCIRSRIFGNALISSPFLVYGGPLASDGRAEEAVVNAAVDLAHDLGVGYLEFRNRQETTRDWEVRSNYATFSKELDPDPNVNLSQIPRKQRAMIRKGIDAGLQSESDDNVDRLYSAMLECKRNLGTPFFGKNYLRDLVDTFGDDVEVLTVTRSGRTVCSVMSFRYGGQILPYYGGGGEAARKYKGNDFMYWAVMEKACQEGVQIFDFGRSMVGSGAYHFKKHWGFEPQTLNYEYWPVSRRSIPEVNPSNPRYRLLIEAWKRMPLRLAGIIGPIIARQLG
ncbi:MAG: FemAB family PEP-CTERM system-associated protein [Gammaproteobacteria bacterium]|nr:FemAB family PEP-CTERM system-associated protein [Gammaproteobacteria bacterium]MDH5239225.1 FemAB family PEP-CTERM system-associated protein [Gammaproteobacteria bacterium]MDH5259910.1 FemAB family PEP-CTERM system-associated protein [Gammaproteobacteria bacterium]